MNKKGFTLVELLAVIAILAILVIIALPNVIKLYNNAKKNSFLTEAKTLAQDVSSKYISESMKGNKLSVISNKKNSLDLSGRDLEYNFKLDGQGKIKNMIVSDGTYCISTNKDYTKITKSDISENCSYEELHNIAGTLMKNFYDKSGDDRRGSVASIAFYSDGRTIEGSESYDVSEEKDGSVKMYVTQNSENSSLVDLTIVANGKIAFPEDSSYLLSFYKSQPGTHPIVSNISYIDFNDSIDTSKATDMSYMFYNTTLISLDLSEFDTSKVTDMKEMFSIHWDDMSRLEEIKGLNGFDTSKVTDMSSMFYNTSKLKTSLDLSSFDTSKVNNMFWMFYHCAAPEIKGLNKFNTSNVTDMTWMFSGTKATSLDVSGFDTSKVVIMRGMFTGTKATVLDVSNFNTSNVTDMSWMFSGTKAASLDVSGFDTSNVTNMFYMFASAAATEIKGLSNFNTSNVNDMGVMFSNTKTTVLDVSNFNTSNVTNMASMFGDTIAAEIKGLDKFDTSKVFNMYSMFRGSQVATLDLSNFDTSKVKYTDEMFKDAKATTGYARTQTDADKFNKSSYKPSGLTFVVK